MLHVRFSLIRRGHGELKSVLTFPQIFKFEPYSSIKVLSTKYKNVSLKYGVILPQQGMLSSVLSLNVSINEAVPASPYKHL